MTDPGRMRLYARNEDRNWSDAGAFRDVTDQYVSILEVERLRGVLELIAAPKRPDGTYNRSREACEQLAREALDGQVQPLDQWCPVCKSYHIHVGETTDAGRLTRPCPLLSADDPRNTGGGSAASYPGIRDV